MEFKIIPNLYPYFINKEGVIKNITTNKILISYLTKKGYKRITFKNKKKYLVHRLVAITFIPNPENKLYVNHIDGNKQNNYSNNLEWVSNLENIKHAIDNNLFTCISLQDNKGSKNGMSILIEEQVIDIKKCLRLGNTMKSLADRYNVSIGTISSIKYNKSWKHIII